MRGLESDTIGGFNSMIAKQQKEEGEAIVSTVLFDDVTDVIHDRVPIGDIKKLTEEDYFVRGCTVILDAVGGAIHHIGNVRKYAREEDRPAKTLFVITTDGLEWVLAESESVKVAQKWLWLLLVAHGRRILTAIMRSAVRRTEGAAEKSSMVLCQ